MEWPSESEERKTSVLEDFQGMSHESIEIAVQAIARELKLGSIIEYTNDAFEVGVADEDIDREHNRVIAKIRFHKRLDDSEAQRVNEALMKIDNEARERGVQFQVE
ncbi:MAG: hypothetical protein AAB796_01750 [Patescibacteria group bacterium]